MVFRNTVFVDNEAGNPSVRPIAARPREKATTSLQWVTDLNGAGSDSCISGVTAADPLVGGLAPGYLLAMSAVVHYRKAFARTGTASRDTASAVPFCAQSIPNILLIRQLAD